MNGLWWSLVVLVGLVVALVGVIMLFDVLPSRRGGVDDAALRRARELGDRHQSPGAYMEFKGP